MYNTYLWCAFEQKLTDKFWYRFQILYNICLCVLFFVSVSTSESKSLNIRIITNEELEIIGEELIVA
jgi:hypothetical protein